MLCLGFYVTPAILGGGRVIMAAMKISSNIELYFSWGAASALGVVLLVVTGDHSLYCIKVGFNGSAWK